MFLKNHFNPVLHPRDRWELWCRRHAGEEEAVGDDVALDHAAVNHLLADFL